MPPSFAHSRFVARPVNGRGAVRAVAVPVPRYPFLAGIPVSSRVFGLDLLIIVLALVLLSLLLGG